MSECSEDDARIGEDRRVLQHQFWSWLEAAPALRGAVALRLMVAISVVLWCVILGAIWALFR